MDIETGILRALLRSDRATYNTALQQGLDVDLFLDEDRRSVWGWITEYSRDYGTLPPGQEVARKFPAIFSDDETPAAAEYYLTELKNRRLHFRVKGAAIEVGKLLKDKDPRGALRLLETAVAESQVDTQNSQDINLRVSTAARLEDYQQVKAMGGMMGFPTPWPTLNKWTLGFRPGEMVAVAARLGVGKSWLLTLLSQHVHAVAGKVPLIVSREMAAAQFARRVDATQARVPFAGLRAGDLSAEQEARFTEALLASANLPDFWISSDDSAMGMAGLAAKVDQLRPDILFLDGMYLMRDDQGETGWEGVTNITRGLKRLAVQKKIPVVITTQLNRKSKGLRADTSMLAYSDSIGQDSDVVIGLLQTDDMRSNYQMVIRLLKQREGLTGEFKARWDLERMNFDELADDGIPDDAPADDGFDAGRVLFT